MRRNKRSVINLLFGVVSLAILILMIVFISPSSSWSFFFITIPALIPFLVLTGLTAYFVPTFLFKSRRHGILISVFLLIYLLFQLWGLTHPFFAVLLLALFLTLELLFTRKQA